MKKNLLKTMLVAILMVLGTTNTWALTPNLSMDYELAGYKAKAFYDMSTNSPAVLPESGDLRFRDGYGLYNFGSGNRGGDVSIPVTEGELLVCQFADTQSRNVTINSISGCTKSTTLSDNAGHLFFEVNTTAETINFNVGRAGCVVSVLVMEKDADAQTADYTLNYTYNETVVKTVTANGAVGGTVLTDASFFAEDVKYFRADGEPESFTIVAGENNFVVKVRLAEKYSYTLTSNLGATLATGTGFEGETVTAAYPRYQLKNDVFYEAAVTNKEYRKSIALSKDNATATVEYTAKDGVNAVFYVEGEDIEGMTASTTGNIPVRASNAVAEADVNITTLDPGKYILHVGIFTSKSNYADMTVNFGVGEETFAAKYNSVNLCEVASEEYTLDAPTDISYLASSSANTQFDYIWIEKTDITTGISEVSIAAENTVIFNMAGQRVAAPVKGINIINGRKVVMK